MTDRADSSWQEWWGPRSQQSRLSEEKARLVRRRSQAQ